MADDRFQKKYERALREIAGLENLIESKSRELFETTQAALASSAFLGNILENMSSSLLVVDREGLITRVNQAAENLFGMSTDSMLGTPIAMLFPQCHAESIEAWETQEPEIEAFHSAGHQVPVHFVTSRLATEDGALDGLICLLADLTEKRQLEMDLRQAQKLEAVGQLAAGVAHEINTPIQFVGNSIDFLQDAVDELIEAVSSVEETCQSSEKEGRSLTIEEVRKPLEEADLDFLREELPSALDRAKDGIKRVATIVGALKQFSHPGDTACSPENINQAIENTMVVARNEYKYIANLILDLGDIPDVVCHIGDINQVVLNLVVNGAHAIEDRFGASGELGELRVSSHHVGDDVEIRIHDNGGGIPTSVQERIFDPFFTTKTVGRGTGQGLAIARNVIVEKHGGTLHFETQEGLGTTFIIKLPVLGREVVPHAA